MLEAMDSTSLTGLDATELAERVRSGRTTAVEVVRGHLDVIARRDPGLNAFREVYADRALAEAAAVDERPDRGRLPLAGVPLAIKANMRRSDELVRRMEAAGCVVVGSTQLPELAMGILPGAGGCVSLTRRIGRQRTALMILSGRRIGARQALDWGLIDAIVDEPA